MCFSNTAVNQLIQRVQNRVSKNNRFKNVIIIRMQSVNTKTQIMHYKTRNNEKIEKIVINSIVEITKMTKFKIALMIHEMNQNFKKFVTKLKIVNINFTK